jgi:hypothetical protein
MNTDPSRSSGVAGRIARAFINSKLTPLIVFAAILLGVAAVVLLPREEEPQIKVPMIDVKVNMAGRAQPGNAKPLSALALSDAELGDKEKAIRESRTACDLLPPAKDAISGVLLLSNLARIYALTGEKDLALKELDTVSKLPWGPSYGDLRLDPELDSLRSDPRFEKIVASLAPKDSSSQAK